VITVIKGYALVFRVNMQALEEREDLIFSLREVIIPDYSVCLTHVFDDLRKFILCGLGLVSQLIKSSLVVVMGSKERNDLREAEKEGRKEYSHKKSEKESVFVFDGIEHVQIVAALISVIFQTSPVWPSVWEGCLIR
jgi:hypothetical protein